MAANEDVARNRKLHRYVTSGHKGVDGWFSRIDAEIFSELLRSQVERGITGGSLEIGIHHGKSFIPLNLAMQPGEVAIAVDIFDQQALNVGSRSGFGNFERFLANVRRHGDERSVRVISQSSLNVQAEHIRALTSGLRFVSVDGGHWYGVVLNDLRLAAACAGEDCVIAIDDIFNPDYAEVAAAYFAWMAEGSEFSPFAASRGKMYLCRPGAEVTYQSALMRQGRLRFNRKKVLPYLGGSLFMFTGNYGGWISLVKKMLEIHAPSVHRYLKARLRPA